MTFISIIFGFLIVAGLLGSFFGIPWGIYLLFKSRREVDPIAKGKMTRKGIWFILGPIIVCFGALSGYGLIGALVYTPSSINQR